MERAPASTWRKLNARYNLVGSECKNCGTLYFPSRIICKKCGRKTKMIDKKFNGNGTVFSFTKIHVTADAMKEYAPYVIGVIKLDEGPMVEGHIVENGKKIEIGTRVRKIFRKMHSEEEGLIHYHFKFLPE